MISDKCKSCGRHPVDSSLKCAYLLYEHEHMMLILKCPYWTPIKQERNKNNDKSTTE